MTPDYQTKGRSIYGWTYYSVTWSGYGETTVYTYPAPPTGSNWPQPEEQQEWVEPRPFYGGLGHRYIPAPVGICIQPPQIRVQRERPRGMNLVPLRAKAAPKPSRPARTRRRLRTWETEDSYATQA